MGHDESKIEEKWTVHCHSGAGMMSAVCIDLPPRDFCPHANKLNATTLYFSCATIFSKQQIHQSSAY